ncbi:unnamed protein product [Lepeophtheirus salmonis]|uniref:(salmon louse) hypothetical protein n=1 Tax=Lepeophtheirus salmonis TaxID=72036 RepID=A0A7R8CHE6_LEPSM|nr:unnamed protein product [Lepeophtheirus salmonis]CAF2766821.1 unnamed protein product [Lepeophtheirus salmonis]
MMARFSDESNKPFLRSPNAFEPINPSPYTSNLNDPQTSVSQSASETTQNTCELNEPQVSLSQSALKTFNEIFVSLSSLKKKNTDLEILESKYKAKSEGLELALAPNDQAIDFCTEEMKKVKDKIKELTSHLKELTKKNVNFEKKTETTCKIKMKNLSESTLSKEFLITKSSLKNIQNKHYRLISYKRIKSKNKLHHTVSKSYI